MEQKTIQSIGGVSEWTGDHGKMFEITLTLDDGKTGRVNAKSPERWSVGDVVVVTSERQTKHGLKWSLDKAEYHDKQSSASGSNMFKKNDNRTAQIEASWAIGQAVAAGMTQDRETVLQAAQSFLNMRDELVDVLKSQNAQGSAQGVKVEPEQPAQQGSSSLPF